MKSPQTPLSVTAEPAALLPCPCCGGQAEIRVEPQYGKALAACCVNVLTCGMRGAWVTLRQDAAEAWNRRADAIAVAEPPIVWRCFHCNFVARTRDEGIEHFGFGMNESPPKCVAAAALAKPTAPINVAAQEPVAIGAPVASSTSPVAATPNEPTAEGAPALREAFIERFKLHDWPLHADGSFWGTVQYQWEGWRAALASVHPVPAPEPQGQRFVYFVLPLSKINDIQLESMRKAIKRCKAAHFTDLDIRINGQNERWQADWFKHLLEISKDGNGQQFDLESAGDRAVSDLQRAAARRSEAHAARAGASVGQQMCQGSPETVVLAGDQRDRQSTSIVGAGDVPLGLVQGGSATGLAQQAAHPVAPAPSQTKKETP